MIYARCLSEIAPGIWYPQVTAYSVVGGIRRPLNCLPIKDAQREAVGYSEAQCGFVVQLPLICLSQQLPKLLCGPFKLMQVVSLAFQ